MNSSNFSNCTACLEGEGEASVTLSGEIFRLVFPLLVMILGVPGNCLILRVYWTKPRKSSTNVLIMALAWADLCVCLFLVYFIGSSWTRLRGKQPSNAFLYVRYGLFSAVSSSVLVTTVIAFDRYDCVCRPHRRLLNPKRATAAVLCLAICALIGNIPYILIAADYSNAVQYLFVSRSVHPLSYIVSLTMIVVCYVKVYKTIREHVKVDVVPAPSHGETQLTRSATSATVESNRHSVALNFSLDSCVDTSAAASTIPPYNTRPGLEAGNSVPQMQRRGSSSNERSIDTARRAPIARPARNHRERSLNNLPTTTALQRKTTRMLLLASTVFLVSWVSYWIYVLLVFVNFCGADVPQSAVTAFYYTSLVLYVNNAVNPLIYGLANRRFRQDCKQVLASLTCC